jgi:predicted restriction endonuclease
MERRKRPASAEFTPATKRVIRERDGNVCVACGFPADASIHQGCLQVHHGKPYARGGSRDAENGLTMGKGFCHQTVDRLALRYGIYFTPVEMNEGEDYTL